MNRVTLRSKKNRKGTMVSLFLEFNPPYITPTGEEIRYEFLNLEKYICPQNKSQLKQNQFVDEIAEQIRCERYIR